MQKQDLNGYRTPLDVARRYRLGDIELNTLEIEELASKIVTDSALSITSENPVQNKVVTAALNAKANISSIPTKTSDLTNDSGFVDSSALSGKQDTLVSGTNIKTINSTTLLGSGDVDVQPTLVSGTNIKTINGASILGSGDLMVIEAKNIMTAYFTSNFTLNATGSYLKLPLSSSISIGTKLTLDTVNNNIVIGAGVSKIKVSAKASFNSVATSGLKWLTIFKNAGDAISANPCTLSARNMIYATDMLVEVQQNDVIWLGINGTLNDVIRSGSAYTYLVFFY